MNFVQTVQTALTLGVGVGAGALATRFTMSSSEEPGSQSQSRGSPRREARANSPRGDRRSHLRHVAETTLRTIKEKQYLYNAKKYNLEPSLKETRKDTRFWEEESDLKDWRKPYSTNGSEARGAHVSILNISTLNAARLLENSYRFLPKEDRPTTGVLNFASATKPGGGFKNGADAQEESIARVSTLFHSLDSTSEARKFYALHQRPKGENSSFYSHSMIYSPSIVVFLNDNGDFVSPYKINVVSCAAVNAKEIIPGTKQAYGKSVEIEMIMGERMGRILYLFELMGIRNIVLGTFGTGVFKNDISMVARHWAHLLVEDGARFKYSFDRVIFAVTGNDNFGEFNSRFNEYASGTKSLNTTGGSRRGQRG